MLAEAESNRILDVVLALLGLALLLPLLLILAVGVRVTSPGPVLYRGVRVGKGGRWFRIFKFRTMIEHAAGPRVTARDDPRVVPFGRFLRRTKLDEAPQLLNVLRGEMSMVGPRPEDPAYVSGYPPEHRRLLEVRPGITSPASIAYRNEEVLLPAGTAEATYRSRILPEKLSIELAYLERRSCWTDLQVIGRTLAALVR